MDKTSANIHLTTKTNKMKEALRKLIKEGQAYRKDKSFMQGMKFGKALDEAEQAFALSNVSSSLTIDIIKKEIDSCKATSFTDLNKPGKTFLYINTSEASDKLYKLLQQITANRCA